jgi:hypothetical protein
MQVLGLTPEVAAVLLVGGLMLIGLGGVIGAVDKNTVATRGLRGDWSGQAAAPDTAPAVVSEFTTTSITPPPFPVPEPAVEPPSPPSPSKIEAMLKESRAETGRAIAESKETAAEIDKVKDRLEQALSGSPPVEPPPLPPEPAAEPVAETAEAQVTEAADEAGEGDDTQLFVVEERLIRGRPARVLSDGTVEAETDDGWMRFENLEHLEEYLDAMSPGQA